jgi:hypothetical protein
MSAIIPVHLSEVITRNHHQLKLSVVFPLNAENLENDLLGGYHMGTIRHAHLIGFNWNPDKNADPPAIHILGWHEEIQTVYLTSRVEVIKLDYTVAQTRSGSMYQIGSYGDGNISERDLVHLCAVMHQWRLGDHFGVPKICY